MLITRRAFGLAAWGGACGLSAAAAAQRRPDSGIRIGVTDWNIELPATVEAIDYAAAVGFEGVEVSLGREPRDGKLVLDDAAAVQEYLRRAAARRTAIAGTCLDILNRECLKNGDRALRWMSDGVRITRMLGAKVMLVPFFGKDCSAESPAEMQAVGDFLKELAPEAARSGVVLGLENWLSAADNARILDRVNSQALRVYYDVGNSTRRGRDVVAEIRWLGSARICQVHIKENPITLHLGEGQMDFKAIAKALQATGFRGWANLEMSFPAAVRQQALRKNLAYFRTLLAAGA